MITLCKTRNSRKNRVSKTNFFFKYEKSVHKIRATRGPYKCTQYDATFFRAIMQIKS